MELSATSGEKLTMLSTSWSLIKATQALQMAAMIKGERESAATPSQQTTIASALHVWSDEQIESSVAADETRQRR